MNEQVPWKAIDGLRAELHSRGWSTLHLCDNSIRCRDVIECASPSGAASDEWEPELYDVARRHLGRWWWDIEEKPAGEFALKLNYDELMIQ